MGGRQPFVGAVSLRVDALRRLFVDAGYEADEALVRARITYYHQVGYYTLGIRQTAERRRQLSPIYYKILTGFEPDETARSSASAWGDTAMVF